MIDAQGTLHVLRALVAETTIALPLDRVVEVARRVHVTPLPSAPPIALGVVVHRGAPLVAIDLRTRLAAPTRTPALSDPFVVVRAARREVVLVVDEVLGTEPIAASSLFPPVAPSPSVRGVITTEEGVWLVQDLDALLHLDEELAIDRALEAIA